MHEGTVITGDAGSRLRPVYTKTGCLKMIEQADKVITLTAKEDTMEIKKVSIIGLGALGILFGNLLSKHMDPEDLRIIADRERIERYTRDGIYNNGEKCDFRYLVPEEPCEPADLLLFAVKFNALDDAVKAAGNQVGPDTIILSLLNGISSESIIGDAYGMEHLLCCVAQGMDAVKTGNQLTYSNTGMLCFGDFVPGVISEKTRTVADFFEKMNIPYEVDTDMQRRIWGKFMLNVGVNQTTAVFETNYGGIQQEGKPRDTMIAAMREVIRISEKEGINLTEEDLQYWLDIIKPLNPQNKPSLRQDTEAKRRSEVDLFSGTVIQVGKKYGIPTPVNQFLYDSIKVMERAYERS